MSKTYRNEIFEKTKSRTLLCLCLPWAFLPAGQMGFMVYHFDLHPDLEAAPWIHNPETRNIFKSASVVWVKETYLHVLDRRKRIRRMESGDVCEMAENKPVHLRYFIITWKAGGNLSHRTDLEKANRGAEDEGDFWIRIKKKKSKHSSKYGRLSHYFTAHTALWFIHPLSQCRSQWMLNVEVTLIRTFRQRRKKISKRSEHGRLRKLSI